MQNPVIRFFRERPAWRLAFGAILVSFAPILVRTSESPPTTSAFYRMLLGGLMLFAFLAFSGRPVRVSGKTFAILAVAGVAFAFDLFFWHRSIHLVGPGLATLLSGFQVFVLALFGLIVLGERLRWQLVVAVPSALLGVALIIGVDWSALGEDYRMGVIFGLATSVCYSVYLLTMRLARDRADKGVTPITEVAWTSLVCAAALAALTTVTGESLALIGSREVLLLAGYALIAQIGLAIISSGLNKVPAALVGLLLLLEPTFAYIWELTLLGRSTTWLELVGAGIALAAIYLGSVRSSN